jgi:antitoxin (DNA-binding transcriptional repressor) of toxin-antitoxin stability system
MKLVSVRDLRTKPSAVWKDLSQAKDLVLTNNGKPIALVSAVTEETLEDALKLLRRMRAATALEKIHQESLTKGKEKTTLEEIDDVISRVRKARKR